MRLLLILFTSLLMACGGPTGVNQISVADLQALDSTALVLDIRTPAEIDNGYVAHALFIDYLDDGFMQKAAKFDKDKDLYIYCKSGGRSAKACKALVEAGFKKVHNVEGGFDAWKSANYAITKP